METEAKPFNALEVSVYHTDGHRDGRDLNCYVELPRTQDEWVEVLSSLAVELLKIVPHKAGLTPIDTAVMIEMFPCRIPDLVVCETVAVGSGKISTHRVHFCPVKH